MTASPSWSCPAGRYTYTITEYVRSTGITPQSITGQFQMVPEDAAAREVYSISGNISYFGKADQNRIVTDVHTFNGTETHVTGTVPLSHVNFVPAQSDSRS